MQTDYLFHGIKGFERFAYYCYRYDMISQEAQRRYKIVLFYQKYGLAATLEAFDISKRTLYRYQQILQKSNNKIEPLIYQLVEKSGELKGCMSYLDKSAKDNFSIENIQKVIVKTKFFDKINTVKLNEKQLKVMNKLLDIGEGQFEGGLTNKKYRGLTKTSAVTASRHLKDMLDKGIIREISGFSGRSSKYELNLD